jgi:hypothetical protein
VKQCRSGTALVETALTRINVDVDVDADADADVDM